MPIEDRYFIHDKAWQRVVTHIENFGVHVKGELTGKPIILPDWFKEHIKIIYGRYDRETHRRAVREVYLEIPKKAGKSLYLSALANYHMTDDGYYNPDGSFTREGSPEAVCLASTREQARLIFDGAQYMVKKSPYLSKRLRCRQYKTTEKHGTGFFMVLSSDAGGAEGLNPSVSFIDELHVHEDGGKMYFTMRGAGVSRPQPLTFIITTAGVYDPTSICWNRHLYAKRVMDDWKYDPHFHGCIYTVPEKQSEDWYLSPEAAAIANPNYPITPSKESLAILAGQARNDPAMLNQYYRYHLNIWVNSYSEWIARKYITAANKGGEIPETGKAWIGFDIGDTDDLTALAAIIETGQQIFYIKEDEIIVQRELPTFSLYLKCFCPESKIDAIKNNSDHITYTLWARDGYVDIAGNDTRNIEYIEQCVDELMKKYRVRGISFDRHAADQLGINLDRKYGNRPDFISLLAMTAKTVSPPMKTLGEMITRGQINTHGNPVFEWMMSNVNVKHDANDNIFPNKKEAKGKIDGVVAAICAVDAWMHDKYKAQSSERFKAIHV